MAPGTDTGAPGGPRDWSLRLVPNRHVGRFRKVTAEGHSVLSFVLPFRNRLCVPLDSAGVCGALAADLALGSGRQRHKRPGLSLSPRSLQSTWAAGRGWGRTWTPPLLSK